MSRHQQINKEKTLRLRDGFHELIDGVSLVVVVSLLCRLRSSRTKRSYAHRPDSTHKLCGERADRVHRRRQQSSRAGSEIGRLSSLLRLRLLLLLLVTSRRVGRSRTSSNVRRLLPINTMRVVLMWSLLLRRLSRLVVAVEQIINADRRQNDDQKRRQQNLIAYDKQQRRVNARRRSLVASFIILTPSMIAKSLILFSKVRVVVHFRLKA